MSHRDKRGKVAISIALAASFSMLCLGLSGFDNAWVDVANYALVAALFVPSLMLFVFPGGLRK